MSKINGNRKPAVTPRLPGTKGSLYESSDKNEKNKIIMEDKMTKVVEACDECPFITSAYKCEEDETVEIDKETCAEDLPCDCPMLDGKPREKDDEFVKLADWLIDTGVLKDFEE